MTFTASKGDTYHLASGPERDLSRKHLFVVCSDVTADEEVLVVSFTTRHDKSDTSCPVEIGDHRFIKHSTVVEYSKAYFEKRSVVLMASSDAAERVTDDLLKRIHDGFCSSKRTPKKIKTYCATNGICTIRVG